ncbi:MAG: class I SAM-dependent methyltransferase [Alphaproteobacteria bacterium]
MSGSGGHLKRLIRRKGPLSLAEFMTEALWHPREGYYAQSPVLGAAGDYVTAPEISQMFGELLGLWSAAAWDRMGRPSPVLLVELGPGRGLMMADALRALRLRPDFRAAAECHLVEASARLAEAQRARLAGHSLTWHRDIAGLPEGAVILIANEFLDALPILQLEQTAAGWRERLVDYDAALQRFHFTLGLLPAAAAALLSREEQAAPVGSVAEVSPAAISLVSNIARRVAADGGIALFIDYGRDTGSLGSTLQALKQHARHDALEAPGSADLTSHVDFAALARAAREMGARVHGPIAQGRFLLELGILGRADHLVRAATAEQAEEIQAALKRLIGGGEMGTLFKALAIAHPALPVPPGFEEVR